MGASSNQMSLQIQSNNRMMMTSMAALGMQSLNIANLFERMAKGEASVAESLVQLGAYALTATSYITALNIANTKRIALQGASAAASVREAAANAASTASTWAKTAAEQAHAVALGIKNALSGPVGWAVIAGATAATAGVLALTGNIPKMAGGAYVVTPTYALVGEGKEGEWVLPDSKLRSTVQESVANSTGNRVGYSQQNITVNIYGVENTENIRRNARIGVSEALSLSKLRRKEVS